MKAVVMMAPGDPDVLAVRDLPVPELPSTHHLLVRLRAAGVNPVDTKLRRNGTYFPDRLPAVLGCDGAGVVEAVGSDVTHFEVGDEIFFMNGGIGGEAGNYAEYTTVHEAYAVAKPEEMSMVEAAALPLVLITAWEALYDRVALAQEQTVLIHAGAGGVGHIALQLARNTGARIATTVRGADRKAFVKMLGAELVVDYVDQDFVETVLLWTDGEGVDVTFDTVGGETFCRSIKATRIYGNIVTLLESACAAADMKLARLRNQRIAYELMLTPMFQGMHEARRAQTVILETGARMVEDGRLNVQVNRSYPLAEVAEAHRAIETGHAIGKIVLTID